MKTISFLHLSKVFLFSIITAFAMNSANCKDSNQHSKGTFERVSPEMDEIISESANIEIIAEGFIWSEGPLWMKNENMLLFSDIPNNSIFKWTPQKGKELYLKPSGYTGSVPRGGETGSNALLLNSNGQLVLCQHGDRRMAYMNAPLQSPKPEFVTIADNYMGKKFDSPNDAVYRSNGDLYFTDPPYGMEKNVDDPLKEAPYQGVYKVSPDGKVVILTDSITRPNGLAFLPGEQSIIVANSDPARPVWYIFDLDENGLFVNGRIFYDAMEDSKKDKGMPDGLKIDPKGNVFATGPGGIWIFNTSGKLLGKIRVNSVVSNCALADEDKTLYVTAEKYVLKIILRE